MKHSKLGIASTLIAIGIWIYFALAVVLFLNTDFFAKIFDTIFSSKQGGMVKGFGDSGVAILLLIVLFIGIPVLGHLLEMIFGLFGIFSKTKNKIFSVIGLILNILPFILGLILFLIGSWST